MSAEENKALVRRFYAEIDRGNIEIVDELVDENYIDHNPPPFPLPPGRAGVKEAFRIFQKATPGFTGSKTRLRKAIALLRGSLPLANTMVISLELRAPATT